MNILARIIRLLAEKAADQVTQEVKNSLTPVAPYLRRLSIGAVLLIVSALAWFTGLLFILFCFFFLILDNNPYIMPALWTGLISWLVALFLVIIGFTLLRKPRS